MAQDPDDDLHELTVKVSRDELKEIHKIARWEGRLLRPQARLILRHGILTYPRPPDLREPEAVA